MISPEKTVVGFIGTGVMGRSMAGHLLSKGYTVTVYNRTREKARELIDKGALWQEDLTKLASACQAVITMVGYPHDVEEVYLGPQGLVHHAQPGTYLIDMTTSSPKLAQKIHAAAMAKNLYAIDAPVSGGDVGAREARLAIMAGGDGEAFAAVKPLLELMGTNIVLQGGPGAGQHTKMCNQIAIASYMVGVCEALAYAKKAGLDPLAVIAGIESGAAASFSLSNLGRRMLAGNFDPGFYVRHFIKDMTIALEAAEEMGLMTPGLRLAKSLYEELATQGAADCGTQALFQLYDKA